MAGAIHTIEGVINDRLWYHYDVASDVLYVRLLADRETPAFGEETPDGVVLLRAAADDRPVGMTIVGWWKRFGAGALPDSLRELQGRIEPWGRKLAA